MEQYLQLCQSFMSDEGGAEGKPRRNILIMRADLTMLQAFMLCSESTRMAEFSNPCHVDMEDESYESPCMAVVMPITTASTQ